MKDKFIYLLLNVIENNTDLKRLVREGMSYSQIPSLTKYAFENNLIEYDDNDKIQLTDEGKSLYSDLKDDYKRTNKDDWIEKDLGSQIPKLNKNTIFVPNQNELTFEL